MTRKCDRGLDDRCRDFNGRIRAKNTATHIGTLRGTYGDDFAKEFRSDMHLGTLLDRARVESLTQYRKLPKG